MALAPATRRYRPWNRKLRSEFTDVPATCTDESMWYGPWDTALHRLFKDDEGFQVASQHLKEGHRGEPEWTIYYLIKAGSIPVCVVEVKPYFHLKRPQKRIDAYNQVTHRLQGLLEDHFPIATVFGVSVIGDRFLIMSINTESGLITPGLNDGAPLAKVAPADMWRNQVLKRAGFARLSAMVRKIKHMCAPFPPRVDPGLSSKDEEESDTSTLSFLEHGIQEAEEAGEADTVEGEAEGQWE